MIPVPPAPGRVRASFRPVSIALALVALAACPGRGRPVTGGESIELGSDGAARNQGTPVGPGPWQEEGGLRLAVPEGWSGRNGPPGSGLLLTIHHELSGVTLEVWAFEAEGAPEVRPRPGCEWDFVDDGSHRIVPILSPARTGTCVGEEPTAPLVQAWMGIVGDREIHVEVVYPHGRVVEGRQVTEPLLRALSWR